MLTARRVCTTVDPRRLALPTPRRPAGARVSCRFPRERAVTARSSRRIRNGRTFDATAEALHERRPEGQCLVMANARKWWGPAGLRLVRPREVPLPGQPEADRRRLRPVPRRHRPNGGGPGPHFHRAMSEAFFVLSGTVKLYDGNDWIDGHPNDFLYVPPGGIHGFRNDADAPASILMLFAPGALARALLRGLRPAGRHDRRGAARVVHQERQLLRLE